MKKLMMAAAASTLLGGCASQVPTDGEPLAEERYSTSIGSNIPRKKGPGANASSTVSAAELEHSRMESGKAADGGR